MAPSDEVVVADVVVTDIPFLADPTGTRDSNQAFSDALGAVSAYGGGPCLPPRGPIASTVRFHPLTHDPARR